MSLLISGGRYKNSMCTTMSHFYATLGKFQFIFLPILAFLQLHIQLQKFANLFHIVSFKLFISLVINSDMHLYTVFTALNYSAYVLKWQLILIITKVHILIEILNNRKHPKVIQNLHYKRRA